MLRSSATEKSVEADAEEAAANQEQAVERGLCVGVENREPQQRQQSAADRGEAGFEGDAPAAAGTSMVLGQVPLTTGTGSHRGGRENIAHASLARGRIGPLDSLVALRAGLLDCFRNERLRPERGATHGATVPRCQQCDGATVP